MIQHVRRLAAILLLALAAAQASAQIDTGTAEQLMRQSGLWQQLDGVAPQMRVGVAEGSSGKGLRVKPTEMERLLRTIDTAYAADRLRATALRNLAAATDPAHVPQLLAWYASEAGREITRLEEAAAANERDPELLMRESAALLATLPAARRTQLREITAATHAAEGIASMMINSTLAVHAGLASAMPEGPATSARELRASLDAQRPQLIEAFTMVSVAAFARIYAPVPDAGLEKYISFLKSPAGAHFNSLGMKAIDAALVEAAKDLGRGMPGVKDAANT